LERGVPPKRSLKRLENGEKGAGALGGGLGKKGGAKKTRCLLDAEREKEWKERGGNTGTKKGKFGKKLMVIALSTKEGKSSGGGSSGGIQQKGTGF